jgi:hypothetical protein
MPPLLRAAALAALLAAPTGCGSDTCDELHDTTFASAEAQPCVDAAMVTTTCKWTLNFHNGRYTWRRGATEELGDFNCGGSDVTGSATTGETRGGSYDTASTSLTWEGLAYVRQ